MKFKARTHDGVDMDTLFCQMETKRRTDAPGHCSPATGFVCAAFDLLLRSNEEGNKRGWIKVFFLESQRDRFGWKINPGTRHHHMICQRADMCQQAREEETERRNERKEGREESRGGIQIEKKNPLLCLSPSYQPSLTRGGGEDGRNSGESSLLNTQEAEDCKWLLARND